jgi:hypothetical protein
MGRRTCEYPARRREAEETGEVMKRSGGAPSRLLASSVSRSRARSGYTAVD